MASEFQPQIWFLSAATLNFPLTHAQISVHSLQRSETPELDSSSQSGTIARFAALQVAWLQFSRVFGLQPPAASTLHVRTTSSTSCDQMATILSLAERVRGALYGAYIGDALAMPVHWYYNTAQLARDFGRIDTYQAPKSSFPGSIMNLR